VKPALLVIAGPNGSGKTTITSRLREEHWSEGVEYLNPDEVARDRFGDWNSTEAVASAARWTEARREEPVTHGHDVRARRRRVVVTGVGARCVARVLDAEGIRHDTPRHGRRYSRRDARVVAAGVHLASGGTDRDDRRRGGSVAPVQRAGIPRQLVAAAVEAAGDAACARADAGASVHGTGVDAGVDRTRVDLADFVEDEAPVLVPSTNLDAYDALGYGAPEIARVGAPAARPRDRG
jgi:hypothetical protein